MLIFIFASFSCVAASDINTTTDNGLIDTSDDGIDDIQTFSLSENNEKTVVSHEDNYNSNVLSSKSADVLKSNSYDNEKSTSDIQNSFNVADSNGVVYLNNTSYSGNDKVLNITNKNILINGSNENGQGFSSFDGTSAANGTLLNITGHSNVTLRNIIFQNFKNTTIKIDNSNVNFIDCSFTGNSVTDGDGGAIYVNGGTVTFNNCNFTNNKAISTTARPGFDSGFDFFNDDDEGPGGVNCQGGAISLNNTKSNFDKCNFINNGATDGGAIYITGGSNNFTNCGFSHNTAETIARTFGGDIGMGVGGAVYINTGNGKFDNCDFNDNRANGTGGAVEIDVADEGTCSGTFNDCDFNNNGAEYGGAISVYDGSSTITNSNFNNNKADYGAGAFLFNTKADFKGSKFNKNSANEQGGAICILQGTGNLDSCNFAGNTAGIGNAIYTTAKLSLNDKNNISMNDIIVGEGASINTKLSISASNHTYGESVPLTINLSIDNKAQTVPVDVYVNNTKYTVNLTNGEGVLNLDNLEPGVYVATVNYNGLSDSVSFSVTKGSGIMDNINLTYKGTIKEFNVNIGFPKGSSGNVTLTVDGVDYTKDIVNDNVDFNIEGNFKSSQDITITYSGDSTNGGFTKKYTLNLNTSSTKLDIVVSNSTYGETVPITINLSKDNVPLTTTINVTVNKNNYIVNITNGTGVLNLNDLNLGIYTVTANYDDASDTANFSVKRNLTLNNVNITVENKDNDSSIIVKFPENATGNVTITVDNQNYTAAIVKDTATFNINRTFSDKENISIVYSGDDLNTGFSGIVPVSFDNFKITANDVTKYYHNATQFYASLTRNGAPVVGQNVTITINNQNYTRTTNENGTVNLTINNNPGVYTVITSYTDPNTGETTNITSTVTVLSTVSGENIVKYYGNGTRYYAKFLDLEGNPLANTIITFNIHGKFYNATTNNEGVASLAINLLPNEYIITAYNSVNNESFSNNITVLNTLNTSNIVKYFHNGTQFSAKIVDGTGNAVAGSTVTFNIHGKFYNRITDNNGVATLSINLNPGDYTITAYNNLTGQSMGNDVKVLPVLTGSDLTKTYSQSASYVAHFVDSQGHPAAGKTIIFNIHGKLYSRTTDSNGDAKLAINLIPGRYVITASTDVNGANAITSNIINVL